MGPRVGVKKTKRTAGSVVRARGGEHRQLKHRDGPELVIITGMSGSGKASALKAFEDLGYYCVDNLPVELIPRFAELALQSGEIPRTALVVDVREGHATRKAAGDSQVGTANHSGARHLSRSERSDPATPLQRDAPPSPTGNRYHGANIPPH